MKRHIKTSHPSLHQRPNHQNRNTRTQGEWKCHIGDCDFSHKSKQVVRKHVVAHRKQAKHSPRNCADCKQLKARKYRPYDGPDDILIEGLLEDWEDFLVHESAEDNVSQDEATEAAAEETASKEVAIVKKEVESEGQPEDKPLVEKKNKDVKVGVTAAGVHYMDIRILPHDEE